MVCEGVEEVAFNADGMRQWTITRADDRIFASCGNLSEGWACDQIDTNLALVFCIGHHANKLKGPGKLRFPRYTLARTRLVLSARMR